MTGSQGAFFDEIYHAMYHQVMCYVISKCSDLTEAEDIIQEVFTAFYAVLRKKGIHYFRNPRAFLMHLAKAKIYRHYSFKEKLKKLISLPRLRKNSQDVLEEPPFITDKTIEERYIRQDTLNQIWNTLRAKPPDVLKVFVLYYYADKPLKEIAQLLNMHISKVKHHLYRTLSELRTLYGKDGDTP